MLTYAANASKLHQAFGNMLMEAGYESYTIVQEPMVKDLCPGYKPKHRFDYYVQELNVIVELHGEQHYEPVEFGGISEQEARLNYIRQVRCDARKMEAALNAGYAYVVFDNIKDITHDNFVLRLKASNQTLSEYDNKPVMEELTAREQKYIDRLEASRERQRLYRQRKYQEHKAAVKANRE